MEFRPRSNRRPLINLVSLIDILSIVLLFFVVTTTFQREEPAVKIDLPKSVRSKPVRSDLPKIIFVTEDKKIFLDNKPVEPEHLGELLKKTITENPDTKIALKASKNAPFEIIIQVMDAVKFAGIPNLPTFTAEEDKTNRN
ncbi:biopolymer transporter ExbD [Methylacidiphilum kamchatkense Kam1]|uniref:Biopolymer transport protein ExbD n=1 Tax=Methylacidiphilum kamchatkense Kam1 TaxID=1202785 RepID=A0A0C1V3X3_9BACT|nr:biopolymer transporter ExbD [Methylacidiphilum kamchatkense]KIE58405.1 biopolymer transporter ExbD [Methylacidiphilum kamchatkense Kam1]QDQ42187.1 biopolymer transport protein ExbD [Methylacidiphilum kamchatkense Kam1]